MATDRYFPVRSCVVMERWVTSLVGVADRAVTGPTSSQNSIPSLPSPLLFFEDWTTSVVLDYAVMLDADTWQQTNISEWDRVLSWRDG